MRVEGDVLPEILVIPEDDGEAAEQHLERALHCHPMVGIDLIVVGVAVMGEMHIAEGFVFVKQDGPAGITDGMIEPEIV